MSRTVLKVVLTGIALTLAVPAQARFGKSGSHTSSSSSSSSSSSKSTTHAATPVGQGSGPSSVPSQGTATHWNDAVRVRPWALGFYSGCYIPRYGYGYASWLGASAYPVVAREETTLRMTAGVEGMLFVTGDAGATVSALATLEGEQFGLALAAQNTSVKNQEGPGYDTLQQVSLRLTWAFLSGKSGRVRAELGGDTFFAPSLIVLAPTGGFSGSLWVGGPVALEGSVLATPWPITQLDYRVGLAVGLGAVGLRAGWRTQVLDDRGVVDGVAHRDVFMGPYAGASFVF